MKEQQELDRERREREVSIATACLCIRVMWCTCNQIRVLCDVYLYRFIDCTLKTFFKNPEFLEIFKDTPICRQALLLLIYLAHIDIWMYAFILFACYIFRLLYEIFIYLFIQLIFKIPVTQRNLIITIQLCTTLYIQMFNQTDFL